MRSRGLIRVGYFALLWLLLVALWYAIRWSGLIKPALVVARRCCGAVLGHAHP